MKKSLFLLLIATAFISQCSLSDGWISLFDGKTLDGWTASEHTGSFLVRDGMICCDGERSHLFYSGEVNNAEFKNFEFSADVMTTPGANSGLYFHTEFQDEGWPNKGYECQIATTHKGEGDYIERKKTASLYGVRNLFKSPVNDNEWFNYRIVVKGNVIQTWINDELMVEYIEPAEPVLKDNPGRRLDSGTFAIQCHDPESKVFLKNIKVKPLPDDLPRVEAPYDPEFDAAVTALHSKNFPIMDLHVHLKGGLTIEQALEHSRKYAVTYGIAVNCGLKFPIDSDEKLYAWLEEYDQPPQTFLAMQAEGREWMDLISAQAREKFDYVFTDAMTWTNKNGKRMRLWIPEETEVGDPQDFMEELVSQIEKILTEPIDVYVNPTYLPAEIEDRYDELWTEERMDRVIAALVKNDVAFEINERRQIPTPKFIKRAKAAGVKFTFGTNNTTPELGDLEYCIGMVKECKLTPNDMWYPRLQ